MAGAARDAVQGLTGKSPETVTALERSDDGWRVAVEVLELERIPSTTDVMATYEVNLDEEGELLWTSPALGVDGVLVHSIDDGVIAGEGEWDPPGGWRPFRVALSSGLALSP